MGQYGTYTGLVRWFDPVNKKGHLLVLKNGDLQTDITGDYWASGATGFDVGEGFWLDKSPVTIPVGAPVGLLLALTYATQTTILGATRVFVGNSSGNKMTWDGTNIVIVGNVTATAGSIGGWTINDTYLAKDTGVDATSAGMAPLDYPYYAGATYANRASAVFRVNSAGEMVATNATITGTITSTSGSIGGWTLGTSTLTGGNATLANTGVLTLGTGDDVLVASAADSTYRLWIGDATAADAKVQFYKSGRARLGYLDANNYVEIRDSSTTTDLVYVLSNQAQTTGVNVVMTGNPWYGVSVALTSNDAPQGVRVAVTENNTSGTTAGYGVWSQISASANANATVYGVFGQALASGTVAAFYGVYGKAAADGWALAAEGRVKIFDSYIEMDEMTEPAAPATNYGRIYMKDNGSGKSQLCVRFATGAVQVLATEP